MNNWILFMETLIKTVAVSTGLIFGLSIVIVVLGFFVGLINSIGKILNGKKNK